MTRGIGVFWLRSAEGGENCRSLASPDFLSRIASSVEWMWFSLRRTTPVVVIETTKQEIRVLSG
jgi:hypothetical protein